MWLPRRSPFPIPPLLGITPQFLDLFFGQLFSSDELIRRFAHQNRVRPASPESLSRPDFANVGE